MNTNSGLFFKVIYLIFIITAVFLLTRLFFYAFPLHGEDGMFVDILLFHPKSPDYSLLGRINGNNIYETIIHPAVMYKTISWLGSFWQWFVDTTYYSASKITIFSHFLFSQYYYFGFLFLFFSLFFAQKKDSQSHFPIVFVLLITAMISPIAIYDSISLQVDTTFGFLISSIYCSYLIIADKLKSNIRLPYLFIASLLFGLGKNEWTVIFLVSQFTSFIFFYILNRRNLNKNQLILDLIVSLTGSALGNFINYSFSPVSYMEGWKLLIGMQQTHSLLNSAPVLMWLKHLLFRLPYLIIYILLLTFIFIGFLKKKSYTNYYLTQYFFISIFLFIPFFLSTFTYVPRYFSPSYAAISSLFIILWSDIFYNKMRPAIYLCIFVLISSQLVFYFADGLFLNSAIKNTWLEYISPNKDITPATINTAPDKCIPLVDSSVGIFSKTDYINRALGADGAEIIAQKYNKKVCQNQDSTSKVDRKVNQFINQIKIYFLKALKYVH